MMNNTNILLITTPFRPNIGGVETHLDDLIEEGISKGYTFSILTYQPLVTQSRGKTIETGKGFKVFRIPWFRMNLFLILEKYPALEFLYLFPPLFFAGLFFLLFNQEQTRVIHAQGLVAGVVGVMLGKIFNKKTIISTHSIYNFPKKGLYFKFVKFLFKSCDKVLCLSYQSQKEILDLGVEDSKVEVFTYWVDQDKFHPLLKKESRDKIHENRDVFICLFVGRLVKGKGIPELLRAVEILKNTTEESFFKKIKFLIIGDGPLAELINEHVKKYLNVRFEGKVNNHDLAKYYSAADVLLVPSTHEEGYGRVSLEALSCGLPIIATNRGGVKEYINEKIGMLIQVTPQNICEAIMLLVKDQKRLNEMSKQAFLYAKIHFGRKNCQTIFKNYE